ncbi:MAG: hypothetical protein P8X93_07060 [Gammaproteobacteria bacterium]
MLRADTSLPPGPTALQRLSIDEVLAPGRKHARKRMMIFPVACSRAFDAGARMLAGIDFPRPCRANEPIPRTTCGPG